MVEVYVYISCSGKWIRKNGALQNETKLFSKDFTLVVIGQIISLFGNGIAGAYQPSVQASIPALVNQDNFMAANSKPLGNAL